MVLLRLLEQRGVVEKAHHQARFEGPEDRIERLRIQPQRIRQSGHQRTLLPRRIPHGTARACGRELCKGRCAGFGHLTATRPTARHRKHVRFLWGELDLWEEQAGWIQAPQFAGPAPFIRDVHIHAACQVNTDVAECLAVALEALLGGARLALVARDIVEDPLHRSWPALIDQGDDEVEQALGALLPLGLGRAIVRIGARRRGWSH